MQSRYRLKNRGSFNYIYKRGKGVRRGHLTLITVPAKHNTRFGFVCGKKVGGAVVRNKVKRRLKEIIRLQIPSLPKNLNYVFIAHDGIANLSYSALEKNVAQVLAKMDVSRGTSPKNEVVI